MATGVLARRFFSCGTYPDAQPVLSANLYQSGKVVICYYAHLIQQPGHPPLGCFQNWNYQAPVLRVGEQNIVDGVLCRAETTGLTCTVTSGAAKGKGFFVNSSSVSRVSPPSNSLNDAIAFALVGGKVDGYTGSISGVVGISTGDNLAFALEKRTGPVDQQHTWSVKLAPREIKINRSKASITVNHPLGPGGADGGFHFTVTGRPHRVPACLGEHHVLKVTLTGTIRLKVGDHFFKTVTVTRMTGSASDTPSPPAIGCPALPCASGSYGISDPVPVSPSKPVLYVDASTQASGGGPVTSTLIFGVDEPTAGTPFTSITHSMIAGETRPRVASNPNLTSATVSTPGGELAGSLSLQSSGGLSMAPPLVCRGGRDQLITRPATVTAGRITARFDSIGKIFFDTDLNTGSLALDRLTNIGP
jgi:hypothetical protein